MNFLGAKRFYIPFLKPSPKNGAMILPWRAKRWSDTRMHSTLGGRRWFPWQQHPCSDFPRLNWNILKYLLWAPLSRREWVVFLFHKPAAGERYSVSLMHLNGEKAASRLSKVLCLSLQKTSVFPWTKGKRKTQAKEARLPDPADSKRLHLKLPASSPLQCISKHSPKNLYTLCLPAMERGWEENRGLQIRSAQILANR